MSLGDNQVIIVSSISLDLALTYFFSLRNIANSSKNLPAVITRTNVDNFTCLVQTVESIDYQHKR